MQRTRTAVELVGLGDVSSTQSDPLADVWTHRAADGDEIVSWYDRVEVSDPREGVACVVHDAVEVVRLAKRIDLVRRHRVEIVLLTCRRQNNKLNNAK